MAQNSLFTILHISDFHFSKRKQREQGIVVEALIADLKRLCIGHRKPDLVLFTGDLVQAAGADPHEDAYDFLIDRVSEASGCSDERIFIVPGNHDLSWMGLEKHADDSKAWRSLLGKPDEMPRLNELFEAGAFNEAIATKFENFFDLDHYLRAGDRPGTRRLTNSFVTVDYIEAINVDVVVFNTAAFSTGGHSAYAKDERLLAIPEYAAIEAASALTSGSLRIFATHHPFGMLSEQNAKYLESEFMKHATIHLFGHMHDPQPRQVVGLRGELFSNQAGAIFTARKEYYNGYALLTVDRDNGHMEALLRSYFKDRNEFDDGIDVIENGRWWSSQAAREHFRKIATPVDEVAFRNHLGGVALDALIERENGAGGHGELHLRFIAPPLRRTFIQEVGGEEGKVEAETAISFADIVGGDANLIIYARAEYGRTSLLREARHRLLIDAQTTRFPRLPVLFDFADVAVNADQLLRRMKGSAEATPAGNDLESLLKLGHACVLVDDVIFSDTARMRVLRTFIERFPKARYILSSPYHSARKVGAYIDPEMPVRFEFVEIQELKRNDMRQLLAQEERCTNVEEWLDRIQDEFREINLPFTAANGSILIEILSEKYNFTPINRSVLMEQFIDFTLRKAAIDQSKRETFDYTNKTDLLSHIAAWMAQADNYAPSREGLRAEMKAYADTRGLKISLDIVLAEFLTARIFVARGEDRVTFRYRGVLEYFIALRMTVDPPFKVWVLEESRYLRFVHEIQYYAGKLRNDAALVDLIGDRHKKILSLGVPELGEINLNDFDTLQLPGEGGGAENDRLAALFASAPLSQREKDAELETDSLNDEEDRQNVSRPDAASAQEQLTLSLLLYSGLVRNMELISDAEKRRHLKTLWNSWSIALVDAIRLAPKLAKDRKIRINGARYEVHAPQGMSSSVLLRQLIVILPHVFIKWISGSLGTEKLERQLTEPAADEAGEVKIVSLLRTGLIADLRLPQTTAAVTDLAEHLRSNPYLLRALVVHLGELRRLDRVRKDHYQALEVPIAGAIANLRGGTHKSREAEKRRQLKRLAKDRLVLKIKRASKTDG